MICQKHNMRLKKSSATPEITELTINQLRECTTADKLFDVSLSAN